MPTTPPHSDDARIRDHLPIFAALILATMTVMLDNSVLNIALPTIGSDLHAGNSALQLIVTAYSVTFGGLLLTSGTLADRVGRRLSVAVGLALMGIASVFVLAAESAGHLAAIRLLTGVGAALVMPASLSLIYVTFTGAARNTAVNAIMSVSMLGFAIGPVLGGFLIDHVGWRGLFLINVPVALIAIPVVWRAIPESRETDPAPADWPGTVTSVVMMGAAIYAITSGPDHGWTSAEVLVSGAVAVAAGAAFLARQLRAEHPMIDLGLLARRGVAVPGAVQTVAFLSVAAVMFVSTIMLQAVHGYSPLEAGLLMLPMVVVSGVAAAPLGVLAEKLGPRASASLGLITGGAGVLLFALLPGETWTLVTSMCIMMAGFLMSLTPVGLMLVDSLPADRAGLGSALNDSFQEIGQALGVAILGAVLGQAYRHALPAGTPEEAKRSLLDALSLGDAGLAAAARHAYIDGAQVALICGAGILVVVGVAVRYVLPRTASVQTVAPERAPEPATA